MKMIAPPVSIIEAARQAALESPCAKSKRGVVLFDPRFRLDPSGRRADVIATGYNHPPEPFTCDASASCQKHCNETCTHAEAHAIIRACITGDSPDSALYWHLVHVKVVLEAVVPGKPPCCWQCSKLILESGFEAVWLYELQTNGDGKWCKYNPLEFQRATLINCGMPEAAARLE